MRRASSLGKKIWCSQLLPCIEPSWAHFVSSGRKMLRVGEVNAEGQGGQGTQKGNQFELRIVQSTTLIFKK